MIFVTKACPFCSEGAYDKPRDVPYKVRKPLLTLYKTYPKYFGERPFLLPLFYACHLIYR